MRGLGSTQKSILFERIHMKVRDLIRYMYEREIFQRIYGCSWKNNLWVYSSKIFSLRGSWGGRGSALTTCE